MNSRTIAFVFARGGSKGLPNKNILKLGKKPLIAHSIELANNINEIENVYVSTDSEDIAIIAKDYGAKIIKRPDNLATDQSPEWLSWIHAVKYVHQDYGEFDKFISLPATSPLRKSNDVIKCLNSLTENIDMVLTMTNARRNPWFNMVLKNDSGTIKTVNNNIRINRRQDAPKVYDLCTIAYVTRPDFILTASGLWEGNTIGVEIPENRSIDIDTEYDFEIADYLYKKQKDLC
tara:strand:+ start:583 stop:1281 length:699 start_codon:yes stop_codon:yes gene_type:complete